MSTQTETTCYRHPSRETRVSCSSCGRPICPDCMTPSPVGMRCPECASQKTQVRSLPSPGAAVASAAPVTVGLIVLNVIAFMVAGRYGTSGGGQLFFDGALFGPSVDDGELYRLVTSGFLHAGFIHIGFNMLLLWLLGRELEPALGSPRFAALYVAALLGGSFGALLVEPLARTVGASGAVYGLMGAFAAIQLARGINPMESGIGGLILINLLLSFALPGISVGGHIGGLVAGGLVGYAYSQAESRRQPLLGWAVCLVVAAASVAGALAVAGGGGL